ncbi:MAG: hypothetical protein Q4F95_02825 [Oscillospiraceae bacterium]|nr:hypothetical protein [Oscillospiraceae bacterium]
MCTEVSENYLSARDEFKEIIETYILPLFDVRSNKGDICHKKFSNKELIEISVDKKDNNKEYLFFYSAVYSNKKAHFCYSIVSYNSKSIVKRARTILNELLKIAEYNYITYTRQRSYGKSLVRQASYKERSMNLAFELGLCRGLTKTEENAFVLHTVICHMVNWASRTYEGKNIPFGIVIDFDKTSNDSKADYLKFLNNDSSAVFTDGVFSGILLDCAGHILSFLSRNTRPSCCKIKSQKDPFVPFQFLDLAYHCSGSSIGVIAMTNGEIIIIKDRSICYAKRGNKWVVFDWQRVYCKLRPYFLSDNSAEIKESDCEAKIRQNIKELYCTLLDVSFAHTGGCIAIILKEKENQLADTINERIDLYETDTQDNKMLLSISEESKEKIEILSYLLKYPNTRINSFFNIDKVLRKEILGLDGATVVSLDGSFYCAGSIVSVEAGSSGGGRTAAAKKLARYGVGIKISEDGYIEAYGCNIHNKELVNNIECLFTFR